MVRRFLFIPILLVKSFYAYWSFPPPSSLPWSNFNLDRAAASAALPKDTDEEQAYSMCGTCDHDVATWQGFLTGINNPITQVWIIADGLVPSAPPVNNALIFTKSTNNPVTDYKYSSEYYWWGNCLHKL